MQQIILKQEVPLQKINAIIHFLKSWDIDAELKITQNNIKPKNKIKDITLISEKSLAKDWLNKEEDNAWKDL